MEKLELEVSVSSEIVDSNWSEFKKLVENALVAIKYELVTEDEFAAATQQVKALQAGEKAVKSALDGITNGSKSVSEVVTEMKQTAEKMRQARLTLAKAIDSETAKRKQEIIDNGITRLVISTASAKKDIANAIKGKRKLDSMSEAVDHVVDRIVADQYKMIKLVDDAIDNHGQSIIPEGVNGFVSIQNPETIELEIERRVERVQLEKQKLEAEAKAKAAEEAAKKLAEEKAAEAKPAVEEPAKAQAPAEEPKKVDSIPVGNATPAPNAETAAQEIARYKKMLVEAMEPLRGFNMVYPENQNKVNRFREVLNEQFKLL